MTFNFGEEKQVQQHFPLYEPVYIKNLFDKENIQVLLELTGKLETSPAQVGDQSMGAIEPSVRRSNVAWITPDTCPPELAKHFQQAFLEVNKKHFEFELLGTESYQYTVYDQNYSGTYNWHIDTHMLPDGNIRKLSMSLLLTDPREYEGGRLLLNNQGNIVVAEEAQGKAIFFPSWMPHCVTPITKGNRKVLVVWAHGPRFK